jgi:hypothetical protein
MLSTPDALGLILELLTWVGLIPGLLFLLAAGIVRRNRTEWRRVDAVAVLSDGRSGYRWFGHDYEVHEAWAAPGETDAPEPGTDVVLYYDARHPHRWRRDLPAHPGRVLLVLGLVLTGVGMAAAVAGFLLLMAA